MSYPLSKIGQKRRQELDPRLQKVIDCVLELMNVAVLCGHRNKEDQDLAFAQKRSKTPWPRSKHNSLPSRAVDMAPYFNEMPNIRWPSNAIMQNPDAQVFARYAYMVGLARGIASQQGVKLRSGMDWDSDGEIADNSFNDLPHLEINE